eukprot:m.68359 g.68359  ORF g.68359 m.68359 type:complete len:500 (+) comp12194_c0_seq1:2257-3756(+)
MHKHKRLHVTSLCHVSACLFVERLRVGWLTENGGSKARPWLHSHDQMLYVVLALDLGAASVPNKWLDGNKQTQYHTKSTMQSLHEAHDALSARTTGLSTCLAQLKAMKTNVQECRATIATTGDDVENARSLIRECHEGLLKHSKKAKATHKGFVVAATKYLKSVDQTFSTTLAASKLVPTEIKTATKPHITKYIAHHLIDHGFHDAGLNLCPSDDDTRTDLGIEASRQLQRILAELAQQQTQLLKVWLKEYNKPPMQPNVAHVAFLIHSAEFVDLVVNANACNAVQYAQNHFGALYTLFPEGVQTLMGTLLQPPDAVKANIKLSHIFDDTLWDQLRFSTIRAFRQLHGLPEQSTLHKVIDIGCTTAASLLEDKAASAVLGAAGDSGTNWWQESELPVDTPVPQSLRHHNVFVCPISKAILGPRDKAPVRLACGHVISGDAAYRLGQMRGQTVSCPYCPRNTALSELLSLALDPFSTPSSTHETEPEVDGTADPGTCGTT